jgi:hypothetical protein
MVAAETIAGSIVTILIPPNTIRYEMNLFIGCIRAPSLKRDRK